MAMGTGTFIQMRICVGCDNVMGYIHSDRPIQRASGGFCKTCRRKIAIQRNQSVSRRIVVIHNTLDK